MTLADLMANMSSLEELLKDEMDLFLRAKLAVLRAKVNRMAFTFNFVLFVNQTQAPIHVLRTSAARSIPIELVGTIDPGKLHHVSATDGGHFVFCNANTRQAMLFTSGSEPDLSGYVLKLGDVFVRLSGGDFLITAPFEVSTLKDMCVESVLTSVGRSVAKIDQLPLPKPLIARLKNAVEDPSDYDIAMEFIDRYNRSL